LDRGNEEEASVFGRPLKANIVARGSATGYRLVLRSLSKSGMPLVETIPMTFQSVEEARAHALSYGVMSGQIDAPALPPQRSTLAQDASKDGE
jgi:hypothetical protein